MVITSLAFVLSFYRAAIPKKTAFGLLLILGVMPCELHNKPACASTLQGQTQRTLAEYASQWGATSDGIRCRLVPMPPTTPVDAIDLGESVDRFDRPEDITFAAELKNVSDRPIKLLDTRYGPGAGTAKGKIDPDRFGPSLYAFEFRDATGQPVNQPEQGLIDHTITMNLGGVDVVALEPGESLKVLLRPARWWQGLVAGLIPGKYRAIVRYRVEAANLPSKSPASGAWIGEVASGPVEFTLTEDPHHKAHELIWGPPANALQAAVELIPQLSEFTFGSQLEIRFHLRNIGNKPIGFAGENHGQLCRAIVINESGQEQRVATGWNTGGVDWVHFKLRPGQEAILETKALGIAENDVQATQFQYPVRKVLICPPGNYTLKFDVIFPKVHVQDGNGKTIVPAEGDWIGTVETGSLPVVVSRKSNGGENTQISFGLLRKEE
jgi:hypothetical protein